MQHWAAATYTAETLVMMVASPDKDGLDFVFTTGQNHEFKKAKGQTAGQTIRKAMSAADPVKYQRNGMRAPGIDMKSTLSKIFDHYIEGTQKKPLTLLIFTDGVWEAAQKEDAVPVKLQ